MPKEGIRLKWIEFCFADETVIGRGAELGSLVNVQC